MSKPAVLNAFPKGPYNFISYLVLLALKFDVTLIFSGNYIVDPLAVSVFIGGSRKKVAPYKSLRKFSFPKHVGTSKKFPSFL